MGQEDFLGGALEVLIDRHLGGDRHRRPHVLADEPAKEPFEPRSAHTLVVLLGCLDVH